MKKPSFCTFLFYAAMASAAFVQTSRQATAAPPTAIQDIQNWGTGLPCAATWNVVGFNLTWHAAQVQAGHRFLPSVFLPLDGLPNGDNSAENPSTVSAYLGAHAADLQYLSANQIPLCLRTTNISTTFTSMPNFRLPRTAASIPQSALVWTLTNGVLDDQSLVDTFGPDQIFADEGTAWGKTAYVQALQQYYPNPPWLLFLENNEGPYEKFGRYTLNGTDAWSAVGQMGSLSLRMQSWLQANPKVPPSQFQVFYWQKRQQKYAGLYAAFDAALAPAWQNKTRTAGYGSLVGSLPSAPLWNPAAVDQIGYAPAAFPYDAGSPALYIDAQTLSDFTSINHTATLNQIPAWQWAESKNPKAFREFSLNITNGGVMAGAKAGKHLVITPALYEGWIQWLLWSMHDQGVPVILRYWTAAATMPSDPFFKVADFSFLQTQGVSGIRNLTQGDYVQPLITSVDRICTDPNLRSFWLNGQPVAAPGPTPTDVSSQIHHLPAWPRSGDKNNLYRVLPCNVNQSSSQWAWDETHGVLNGTIKVWAVAVTYNNQALLYAWSPCKLSGNVTVTIPGVGTVNIAAPQPWGYWLVNGNNAVKLNLSTTLPTK